MTRGDAVLAVCGVALALLLAAAGCAAPYDAPAPETARAVPDPDLGRMEPQVARALGEARQRVLAEPASAEAWGNLASLYDAHSLFEPAEACYRRAVELAPQDFRWTYLLAIVRDIRGAGPDETRELFAAAAALDADYAPIHIRLGEALARHGLHDEARASLERAVELAPDLAVAHRLLGQVCLALGRLDEAAAHLERALELEPRDLTAHAMLSQVYLRAGDDERARQVATSSEGLERINVLEDYFYDRWVFERSLSSSRVLERARIRLRDGDFQRAADELETLLAAQPSSATLHAMLGEAYAELGRREDAVRQLERALVLDPDLSEARERLARLR